jgi:hypothetical protein
MPFRTLGSFASSLPSSIQIYSGTGFGCPITQHHFPKTLSLKHKLINLPSEKGSNRSCEVAQVNYEFVRGLALTYCLSYLQTNTAPSFRLLTLVHHRIRI